MDTEQKTLASLQARAQKALELSRELLTSSTQAAAAVEHGILKLNESHQNLEQIIMLLKEQERATEEMVKNILAKSRMGTEAERLYHSQSDVLTEYQKTLHILQAKRIHPALEPVLPLDIPKEEATKTLADWANTPELEKLEEEAVFELIELEKLYRWVEATIAKTKAKYAHVKDLSTKLEESSAADFRLQNTTLRIQETRADLAAVRDLVTDIAMLAEKLAQQHQKSASSYSSASTSTSPGDSVLSTSPSGGLSSGNLLIMSQSVENLPDKLVRVQLLEKKLTTLRADVEARAGKYSAIFSQCTAATNVYHMFGQECQAAIREFDYLDTEFEAYKQSAPTNVFPVLKTSSDAWKRFMHAYEEMLMEIARRKREFARKQQIIDAYQKELDALYSDEMRERKRFEELYMKDFPLTWSQTPLLMELPPKYKIYPERYATSLPDVGDEYSRRDKSLFQPVLDEGNPAAGSTSMAASSLPAGAPDILFQSQALPSLDESSLYMSSRDLDDSRVARMLLEQSSDDSLGPAPATLDPYPSFSAASPRETPQLHPQTTATDLRLLNP